MTVSPGSVRTALADQQVRAPLHTIVTLLCIVSGSLDAIAFLTLGNAFASVMTGNIVFIGISLGTLDSRLALYCGLAIVSYVLGVLVGSWLAQRWTRTGDCRIWPSSVTKTLGVQLGVLSVASVVWILLSGEVDGHLDLVFLSVAASVMGVQGAAVRKIGVQVSTTYMTGALTTLLEALVTRRRFSGTETSAVGGLTALAAGALLGSVVLTHHRALALVVPTLALSCVVVVLLWSARRRRILSNPHAQTDKP
jgi:uncharacterized membrane protein YoaK (UPF0700 family)